VNGCPRRLAENLMDFWVKLKSSLKGEGILDSQRGAMNLKNFLYFLSGAYHKNASKGFYKETI
jgi:hypothetical protein